MTVPRPESIRVAIVEDHDALRASLARLISRAPGYCCVAACPDGETALRELPLAKPHVVLMDLQLPRMSGAECIARLRELLPEVEVLVLTVYDDEERVFDALKAGASGYLLKRADSRRILEAIAEVRAGGAPMTSEIARKVVRSFRQEPPTPARGHLTPREEEILNLLAEGLVPKEVAARLGISYFTVQTHIKSIYEKLHVRSRTEAVLRWIR
ncbi:MAG: response regulator transcription factor [Kiritimatiellae bacterium]|nr:response regulator transcription factor [Kiritimatiellia bacterium]